MNCEDARLLIGADPGAQTPALEEHVQACAPCARFRDEMRALDERIGRAMRRPPDLPRVAPRHAPARVWREWALAASLLVAFALTAVWVLRPTPTLAHDVVAHVQHEPQSWFAKEQVSAAGIEHALQGAGVRLDLTSDKVVYARSCWFRGHYVPHLVVQTAQGPATVLILRHEDVRAPAHFAESGMTGIIVPARHGSIAVLTRGGADVMAIAGRMQQDMHWLPDAR